MRLFVAVHLTEDVRERLAAVQDRLRPTQADVSWVKAANMHITLKFLGETAPKQVEGVRAALTNAAIAVAPFSIEVAGVGTFGGRVPRIVWVGVRDGAQPLEALARTVEERLARVGFPKEKRGFTAHFTLGRVRSPRNAESLVAALRDVAAEPFGTVGVERFYLMHSQLDPQGSIYTALDEYSLTGR